MKSVMKLNVDFMGFESYLRLFPSSLFFFLGGGEGIHAYQLLFAIQAS